MEPEEDGQEGVVLTQDRYAELTAPSSSCSRFRRTATASAPRLRVPDLRARREGHHRHDREPAERQAGRVLPGRGQRPDHAGDRWRPAHPRAGPRHLRHGPLDARRDRVLDRGRTSAWSRSSTSPRSRATATESRAATAMATTAPTSQATPMRTLTSASSQRGADARCCRHGSRRGLGQPANARQAQGNPAA